MLIQVFKKHGHYDQPPIFSLGFISLCNVVQTSFHRSYTRAVSLSLSSFFTLHLGYGRNLGQE